jgi:hypothetical protein
MVASSNFFFGSSGFYPYEIGQSCRFSEDNSEYLSRAVSSSGNRKTFTMSCWVKRGDSTGGKLFSSGTSATEITEFAIQGDDYLRFRDRTGGDNLRKDTTALLRDMSAWYHLVCAVDVTQASNSNRVKIYINGTLQTAFDTDDTFVNRNTYVNNSGNDMVVGKRAYDSASLFDGYMAEYHFIDGTQVTADSFGETKEGVWIPKAYTGSYGTNGFYLKFNQTGTGTASASTIGADSSGEDNHFTSTNLASIDSNRTDSPTNNFATWNPLLALDAANYGETGTLVNGALELDADDAEKAAWSTMTLPSSGKYYVEMRCSSTTNFVGGIMAVDGNINRSVLFQTDGTIDHDNAQVQSSLTSYTDGNTIGMRLDMDSGTIAFYLQDSAYGSAVTISSYTQDYALMCYGRSYVNFRTDPRDFAYSIPSGYSTLSTANLPEPTISPLNGDQPADYFNTVLYTGNGSSQNVSGLSFQPDWVWIKSRSSGNKHKLYDAVRGVEKTLSSVGTDAESTESTTLTEFRSDGFAVGSNDAVNKNTDSMVAWNWKAGGAPSADNSAGAGATPTANSVKIDGSNLGSALAGTIAATRLTANTEAGFSIVSYTGSGSNATVAHGLGVAPKWVIVKKRNGTADWDIWQQGMGDGTKYMVFTDQALLTATNIWNSTIPTSSVFSVGTHTSTNNSSDTYIAYCFAEIEGYSKFGSYTGNGDADGPFVYTGFRPAWVMYKNISSASTDWIVKDSVRQTTNMMELGVRANKFIAEESSLNNVDFLSNGIKFLSTGSFANDNNDEFIYMAFAEMPFKYANAR